jgi:hypothetical protein
MRLSFPSLPSTGQSFSFSGRTWKWSGNRWDVDSVVIKSPYQIAVEGGFQGTEAEYADSINPTTVAQNAASAALAQLTAAAPAALDTIAELASALGNDSNFATTITNALALKANASSVPNITISTSNPSGGNNGDIWLKYTA